MSSRNKHYTAGSTAPRQIVPLRWMFNSPGLAGRIGSLLQTKLLGRLQLRDSLRVEWLLPSGKMDSVAALWPWEGQPRRSDSPDERRLSCTLHADCRSRGSHPSQTSLPQPDPVINTVIVLYILSEFKTQYKHL